MLSRWHALQCNTGGNAWQCDRGASNKRQLRINPPETNYRVCAAVIPSFAIPSGAGDDTLKYRRTSRSAIPCARVATRWSAMHVWPRSTTLVQYFTMRRRITPHSSHVPEPDEHPPRHGFRRRTAHQMVSDDKSHEDASRHQSPPKRPKRTPAFTCAHSPSPRDSAKKRTKERSGRRHTQKDEDKAWSTEAILEESDSQYLIQYKPVYEGAQCEISWQPKHYANAALIAWLEERKMEIGLENGNAERDSVPNLLSEDNKASQHYTPVERGGRPQEFIMGLLLLEQYDTKSEGFQQYTVYLVEKRTLDGSEEPLENTLLEATSTIIPEIFNIPMPEINVTVSQMYDHHRPRELRDSSRVASNNPAGVSSSPRFKVNVTVREERERERGFIPPGAKHLKGNRLSTSQSLYASH
jgi:hypothetical protein